MATDIVERTITVAATSRPKLGLQTPKTSTFPASAFEVYPSELSARTASARSPIKGYGDFMIKQELDLKTPITPPLAYLDFLKAMSPATDRISGGSTPTSAPSTASSTATDHSGCSCNCETHKSPVSAVLPSPFKFPQSAPSSARLDSLRIPQSPANENAESPMSASSAVRSPFSARPGSYDFDIGAKGRYYDIKSPKSGNRVRHVREIVTRTVTYTPRMGAAPKGKRRKIEIPQSQSIPSKSE